jgi:hypothetical protein
VFPAPLRCHKLDDGGGTVVAPRPDRREVDYSVRLSDRTSEKPFGYLARSFSMFSRAI